MNKCYYCKKLSNWTCISCSMWFCTEDKVRHIDNDDEHNLRKVMPTQEFSRTLEAIHELSTRIHLFDMCSKDIISYTLQFITQIQGFCTNTLNKIKNQRKKYLEMLELVTENRIGSKLEEFECLLSRTLLYKQINPAKTGELQIWYEQDFLIEAPKQGIADLNMTEEQPFLIQHANIEKISNAKNSTRRQLAPAMSEEVRRKDQVIIDQPKLPDPKKKIDNQRMLEEKRNLEEESKLEYQRILNEQNRLNERNMRDMQRKIEEGNRLEEQRLLNEQRVIEEQRIFEEEKRKAEQRRIEEQRIFEEEKRKAEQRRIEEQNRLKSQRNFEQQRKLEENKDNPKSYGIWTELESMIKRQLGSHSSLSEFTALYDKLPHNQFYGSYPNDYKKFLVNTSSLRTISNCRISLKVSKNSELAIILASIQGEDASAIILKASNSYIIIFLLEVR